MTMMVFGSSSSSPPEDTFKEDPSQGSPPEFGDNLMFPAELTNMSSMQSSKESKLSCSMLLAGLGPVLKLLPRILLLTSAATALFVDDC